MKNQSLKFLTGCFLLLMISCQQELNPEYIQWQIYGGDNAATGYSALDQINISNVQNLEPVWTYKTHDARKSTTIQCNPIIIRDKMFIVTPGLKVVALKASNGIPIWTFDPFDGKTSGGNSRGVTYWTDGQEERLFYGVGAFLYALKPKDGELIASFGEEGKLDLHTGLGDFALNKWVGITTPGIIYKDLIICGSRVGEGPAKAAPGHIRAFDVKTGELKWVFRTIPAPGTFGADTWTSEKLDEMGGANSWGGFTLDEERGMVFCGTGSAAFDHWGGNRIGANLFANCILALDAATGKRIWHYQVVHHDIWDYDIPCQPNLVQVKKDGQIIDAVAQPTKMGHLFVLDRETGAPLFPVREVEVPQSEIPGEQTWPTQPFPPATLRYGQQQFLKADITNISPESTQDMTKKLSDFVLGNVFLPPGVQPTITMPQFNGGTDWGGASYDPINRFLYVNCSNEAEWISMIPAQPKTEIAQYDFGLRLYQSLCSSCHGNSNAGQLNAPGLSQLQKMATAEPQKNFRQSITAGKGLMPSFAQLSQDELDAIIALIKQEGKDVFLEKKSLELSFSNEIPWIDTGHRELKDQDGFPANKPPWGTMTAIDLDKGQIAWQVPLGTYPDLEKRGFPPTGTFNMGGSVVTSGGLVFIAAAMDERIRAYDKNTGATLWEYQMDAGGYATPATYEINGQQLLVIGAGGGGKPGTKSGDTYYCFGLK